jgi:hypothetical protein
VTRRLRIAHVIIQPVLIWDDGENLEPGPRVGQVAVPLHAIPDLPDRLRAEVAALAANEPQAHEDEEPEGSGRPDDA